MRKLLRLLAHDWPAHFVLVLTNWLPDNAPFLAFRGACLRPFLGGAGANLRVGRNTTFYNPSQIFVGDNVYVACGCWVMAGAPVTMGEEVMLGPYCVIVSSDQKRQGLSFRFGETPLAPIEIRRGCWLGAHVTVVAGVIIGEGCLVAAGAVVVSDVPPSVMLGGVPGKVIKTLSDEATSVHVATSNVPQPVQA
jgi:acetyltransferase-like isoleucine patch superfamily enzyme